MFRYLTWKLECVSNILWIIVARSSIEFPTKFYEWNFNYQYSVFFLSFRVTIFSCIFNRTTWLSITCSFSQLFLLRPVKFWNILNFFWRSVTDVDNFLIRKLEGSIMIRLWQMGYVHTWHTRSHKFYKLPYLFIF